jgi:hypothetical protein
MIDETVALLDRGPVIRDKARAIVLHRRRASWRRSSSPSISSSKSRPLPYKRKDLAIGSFNYRKIFQALF